MLRQGDDADDGGNNITSQVPGATLTIPKVPANTDQGMLGSLGTLGSRGSLGPVESLGTLGFLSFPSL